MPYPPTPTAFPNQPREKAFLSLVTDPEKKGKTEKLLGGNLLIHTLRGMNPVDRLLMEACSTVEGSEILTLQVANPLHALAFGALRPGANITCWSTDLYHTSRTRAMETHNGLSGIRYLCQPVPLPATPPDLITASFTKDGEAAFALELLRAAEAILAPEGKILVAINNGKDRWLHKQIATLFGDVTLAAQTGEGRVYLVKKRKGAAAQNAPESAYYVRQLSAPWHGRKHLFFTCYGIFSSAQLDQGSLALLETIAYPDPCKSLLDLGCGWGGMAILAEGSRDFSKITLIDSSARAVDMARRNVDHHGIAAKAEVRLESNAESIQGTAEQGAYDVVVSNPPYGTDFRVADLFVHAAHRALRRGGTAWMVVKSNSHVAQTMQSRFGNCGIIRRRGYEVLHATRT